MSRKGAARAAIFSALGDETRLELVSKLLRGEARSIAQLTEGTDLTRQAVTKHLKVLEAAGWVRSEREGRESRYELDPSPIREIQGYLDHVSQQWDGGLARLKRMVED